ncbi:MAG: GNAT family protein [Paraburkholderia sp.]|uniref:GNAT family N-acetyltransferase n=1 Tax=Paraburkholderia sp. TaxID=1926495 RepID=UPI003C67E9FA
MHRAPLIRLLNPADRDAFFQLRLRGLQEHPESFGQSYEEALAKGPAQHDAMLEGRHAAEGNFILGAFGMFNHESRAKDGSEYHTQDGEMIGTVGLVRNQSLKQRHKASVVGMYVALEAAGRGVGRALLMELLALGGQVQGLRQIQLLVSSNNEPARHLYESLGFRHYGREIEALCINGQFHDADMMARFL